MFREYEVCSLPAPLESLRDVTEVKGSMLVASIRGLREEGHYHRYLANLAPQDRELIPFITAGEWVPIGTVLRHYLACDALGLSVSENVRLGDKMATRINSNLVSTIAIIARASGVTPFTILGFAQRAFGSVFRGGGVRVVAVGEKEARFEMFRNPALSVPWHRNGWCGNLRTNLQPLCKTCRVTVEWFDDANARYRVVWA